jgi:hypothetical protein
MATSAPKASPAAASVAVSFVSCTHSPLLPRRNTYTAPFRPDAPIAARSPLNAMLMPRLSFAAASDAVIRPACCH